MVWRLVLFTLIIAAFGAYGHHLVVGGGIYELNERWHGNRMKDLLIPVMERYGIAAACAVLWVFWAVLWVWGALSIRGLYRKDK